MVDRWPGDFDAGCSPLSVQLQQLGLRVNNRNFRNAPRGDNIFVDRRHYIGMVSKLFRDTLILMGRFVVPASAGS